MNTEKGFVKSKAMAVVIAVLAVIVLAAVPKAALPSQSAFGCQLSQRESQEGCRKVSEKYLSQQIL